MSIDTLTLRRPDDWHLHLRDGDALAAVLPHTARRFARAIVMRPDLILYDEPTTGLDPIVTHLITDTIVQLRAKLNGTAVVISHDLQSIYMMADYVAMLFEGAIIAYGTVDEVRKSPNPLVQQFLRGSEVGPIPI
jgi:phospholipid/cholesterol/gamma-HCH transport system ATP-binding protein